MIKDLFNKHLPKAFSNQLADAISSFTALRKNTSEGEYDPVTDTYTRPNDLTYGGRGAFSEYELADIAGTSIDIKDVELMCLQVETGAAPAIGDIITKSDGTVYRTLAVSTDPADVSWVLQLRATS